MQLSTIIPDYNQELDALFEEWEEVSEESGLFGFCRDGLLFKGEIFHRTSEEYGRVYWGRKRGNENELWHKAEKRILFLTKDPNGNPNEDMRSWIGRQHLTDITNRFFKNIALWFYGLKNLQQDGSYLPFEKVSHTETFSKHFDDNPISIVNVKKESGGSSVSDQTLYDYVGLTNEANRKFGSFLQRQVEILKPNVVVCCGSNVVSLIARQVIFPHLNFEKFSNWIYYNPERNILLIDGYHPTHRRSDSDVYTEMLEAVEHFVKRKNRPLAE